MKRMVIFSVLICCFVLTACDAASVGIIGGADGPTKVYVKDSSDDYKKYFNKCYVRNVSKVNTPVEPMYASDDRILIIDDDVENEWELVICDFYRNMTAGSYAEMKKVINDESLLAAVTNEEKNFNDGIYYKQIRIDDLELLDRDDLEDIADKNKKEIAQKLSGSDVSEFGIVELEADIKFNDKMLSTAPQVGEGEITRYYLIGKKDNEYKIFDVYWDGFLID